MTSLHGRGGMLYLQGSGAVAVNVLNARSWKLTVDRALDENNKFGDTWVTQLLGLNKWTLSCDGNLDNADTGAFDAATGTTVKAAYFYPDSTSASHYYYGNCWPKIDVTVTLDAVERYTMDGDGDGPLAYK
jgi:hypothetical protein